MVFSWSDLASGERAGWPPSGLTSKQDANRVGHILETTAAAQDETTLVDQLLIGLGAVTLAPIIPMSLIDDGGGANTTGQTASLSFGQIEAMMKVKLAASGLSDDGESAGFMAIAEQVSDGAELDGSDLEGGGHGLLLPGA
jgi:hypothetical protein